MGLDHDVAAVVAHAAQILGIDDPSTAEALEAVSSFYVLQDEGLDETDAIAAFRRMHTGGTEDNRLDAIALFSNGELVGPDTDVDAMFDDEETGVESLRWLFVQATGADPRQQKLGDKLNGFLTGVLSFFTLDADAPALNEQLIGWLSGCRRPASVSWTSATSSS